MLALERTTAFNPNLSRTVVNGYPFYTETYGSEKHPTIIVIHGGPGGDFASLLPLKALSDQFRVVFYDQRGTGLSPREKATDHTIEKFLLDLDGIVNAYGNGMPVHLIGHSWGGMLAAAYIARHGEKIASAVIAEPGILIPESAIVFFETLKQHKSLWSIIKIIPHVLASLFVVREDGHEPGDYVMTRVLESGKGKPYQCKGERLPKGSFRRGRLRFFRGPDDALYEASRKVHL
jgi:proline iminopeptidase